MREVTRHPRTYELLTILTPDVPEDQIAGAVEQIASYITGVGGAMAETLQESPWGRRRLAYPIRHSGRDVRDGYYTVFHFDLDPLRVVDVEREILLNDQIMRYLVTHYTAPPARPQEQEEPAPSGDAPTDATVPGAVAAAEVVAVDTAPASVVEEPTATEAATGTESTAVSSAEVSEAPEASAVVADAEAVAALPTDDGPEVEAAPPVDGAPEVEEAALAQETTSEEEAPPVDEVSSSDDSETKE